MIEIINSVNNSAWAITQDMLKTIVSIAQRENEAEKEKFKSLLTESSERMPYAEDIVMRGNVAIIPVTGPIFRRANIMTRHSGAMSLQQFAERYKKAIDNKQVESIVLHVDSPGGEASDIAEMAKIINESQKPVYGYTGNLAASGGYWILSATQKIFTSETALMGSIGVIATYFKESKESKQRRIEIISSQSPDKRIDIESEDGASKMQKLIDEMAQIFVNNVAQYRKVDSSHVINNFGKGGLLMGASAVEAGMADEIETLESLISRLNSGSQQHAIGAIPMSGQEKNQQEPLKIVAPTLESIKSDHKDVFDEIYNMGASQERDRIKSVQSQLMPGYEEQIATMMFDGKSTDADAALMIVQGEKKSLEAAKNSIKNTQDPVPDAPAPHKKSKANLQGEELYKAEWEEDESLKASFIDFENYAAFRSAEDAGQVRVLGKS